MRVADVVKSAGYTTGAAYQIWKSQVAFQSDLALFVARNTQWAGSSSFVDGLTALLTDEPDFEEMLRQAGRLYIEEFQAHEDFFTALYFSVVRVRRAELTEAIREGYAANHTDFRELYLGLLDMYGRRVREPYTVDDACVAVAAAVEGLTLRNRVDAGAVRTDIAVGGRPWHLFSTMLLALSREYTEPSPR